MKFSAVNLETGYHLEFRDIDKAYRYVYTHPTDFDPCYTQIESDDDGADMLDFYHNENHRICRGVFDEG